MRRNVFPLTEISLVDRRDLGRRENIWKILTGKLFVLSATFLLTLYKIADVETLTKNFRDKMVEQLIDFCRHTKSRWNSKV